MSGPRESAYDEHLAAKIGEVLKLAQEHGVPMFLCVALDGDRHCTSMVGHKHLRDVPKLRDMFLIAQHDFRAVGVWGCTFIEGRIARMQSATLNAYNEKCEKIHGALA